MSKRKRPQRARRKVSQGRIRRALRNNRITGWYA